MEFFCEHHRGRPLSSSNCRAPCQVFPFRSSSHLTTAWKYLTSPNTQAPGQQMWLGRGHRGSYCICPCAPWGAALSRCWGLSFLCHSAGMSITIQRPSLAQMMPQGSIITYCCSFSGSCKLNGESYYVYTHINTKYSDHKMTHAISIFWL